VRRDIRASGAGRDAGQPALQDPPIAAAQAHR
jgi:hypothetical protein